jgi:hypothetical protein
MHRRNPIRWTEDELDEGSWFCSYPLLAQERKRVDAGLQRQVDRTADALRFKD